MRTTNPRIFAAGDVCLEHAFTNTAEAAARIVVRNALFLGRQRVSALLISWCTYTDPQVAHVGPYVQQARKRNISVKTCTVAMATGMGMGMGMGLRLRQLAQVVHAYPTQGEAIRQAGSQRLCGPVGVPAAGLAAAQMAGAVAASPVKPPTRLSTCPRHHPGRQVGENRFHVPTYFFAVAPPLADLVGANHRRVGGLRLGATPGPAAGGTAHHQHPTCGGG